MTHWYEACTLEQCAKDSRRVTNKPSIYLKNNNAVSVKYKAKHNKTRYACIIHDNEKKEMTSVFQ